MARHGRQMDAGTAAFRGAAAGLVGGASVLALSWLVHRGIFFSDDTVDDEWERLVRSAAKRAGMKLDRRQARATRIAVQLGYAALVGAGYGVAFTRRSFARPIRSALNSALVHAASIPAIARSAGGRAPRRRRKSRKRGLTVPLGSAALYGIATSTAFRAFSRA